MNLLKKITLLIEENLSSEKIDITYLSDKMYERFHPLPENESTDRIIDQRIYPESENAKMQNVYCLKGSSTSLKSPIK